METKQLTFHQLEEQIRLLTFERDYLQSQINIHNHNIQKLNEELRKRILNGQY